MEDMEENINEEELDEQEEIVVEDNSEETEEVNDKETEEEVNNEKTEKKKYYSEEELREEVDKNVKGRLARERKAIERENAPLYEIENTLKTVLGVNKREELVDSLNNYYKEQGLDIPKYASLNNKDAERLGKLDAQEMIEVLELKEIEERLKELASLKEKDKMNYREEVEFLELGKYLSNELKIRELKEKGIDQKIIGSKEFREFSKKFNKDTPITEVYDLYSKINIKKVNKPASTGSTKSNITTTDKDFYSKEEVANMSKNDVKKNYDKIRKSMEKWD